MSTTFDLTAGDVSLDFANTVEGTRAQPSEKIHTFADLIEWARQAGAVDEPTRKRLLRSAEQRPREAVKVLRRALDLREAIFAAFDARSSGKPEPAKAIEIIDREAREAATHRTLRRTDGRIEQTWAGPDRPSEEVPLDRPIWPVALAAADLLTAPDLPIVKECASETCDWLFIDRSRNSSRRWCSMSDCGNRAKARRHYARTRGARSQQ